MKVRYGPTWWIVTVGLTWLVGSDCVLAGFLMFLLCSLFRQFMELRAEVKRLGGNPD